MWLCLIRLLHPSPTFRKKLSSIIPLLCNEDIKSRLSSGEACYRSSVKGHLPTTLLKILSLIILKYNFTFRFIQMSNFVSFH
jgi:hypothetical protein